MSTETMVVRLLCEGGRLRAVGPRAVQAGDLPEVQGRVVRFEVEGGTATDIAPISIALSELVRVARERGATRVETLWQAPPVVRAARALEAGMVERDGATSVEALVQMFAERLVRLQSQPDADRLAAELERAGEGCSAVALAIHTIAWCASRARRATLFEFLAVTRAAELSAREPPEGVQ